MKEANRVNESPLAEFERLLLEFLVRHVPTAVQPDHLTLLGLGGALLAFAGYALVPLDIGFLWLASFGLLVHWLGDSLDGTLARHRQQLRPHYGFFVDRSADLFAQIIMGLGLSLCGEVRFEVGIMTLIAFLAINVFTFIHERATGVLRITFFHIGPTEIRISMISLNAFLFFVPRQSILVGSTNYSAMDLLILLGTVLTLSLLAIVAVKEARRLSGEDPPTNNKQ